jgi:hypothetical protein
MMKYYRLTSFRGAKRLLTFDGTERSRTGERDRTPMPSWIVDATSEDRFLRSARSSSSSVVDCHLDQLRDFFTRQIAGVGDKGLFIW